MVVTTDGERWIGRPIERTEDRRLLLGAGRFTDDFNVPGQLYCAILRSPHAHARIVSVDTSAASALPGVVAAVSGAEAVPHWTPIPPSMDLPGVKLPRAYALAVEKVVYDGEPVAAVAAVSRHAARDALAAIAVEYEPLPALVSPREALGADGAPPTTLLHETWGDNVQFAYDFAIGDVEAVFEQADVVVREQLEMGRHGGMPMEPRAVLAQFDRATGHLTVRMSTQLPHAGRYLVAEAFGLPERRVRVLAGDLGGGYGNKCCFDQELVPILLAKLTGRPVKWTETRTEWLRSGPASRDFAHDVEAAFSRDGKLLGIRDRLVIDVGCDGAARQFGLAAGLIGASYVPGLYEVDTYAIDVSCVVTNKAPYGAYRAFGKEIANLAIERIMDAGARELGIDPVELRRRNLIRDMPYEMCSGPIVESGDYRGCLDAVEAAMDLPALRARQEAARAQGRFLGIALTTFLEPSGAAVPASVFPAFEMGAVRMLPDGGALVLTGIQTIGQGSETALAQIAAERLGISPDDVEVVYGDTTAVPQGSGSFSSRGASYAFTAVHEAASEVRGKLVRAAAAMLEADEGDLVVGAGRIAVVGTSRSVAIPDVTRAVYYFPGAPLLLDDEPDFTLEAHSVVTNPQVSWRADEHGRIRLYPTHAGGAQGMVVEVDPGTGEVRVERVWICHDIGRVVNPAIVEGQVIGATVQGIGGMLLENLPYGEDGRLLARTLTDYQLPNAITAPPITVLHVETPSPITALGTKGVGECGCIGTPAALMAAVEDALAPLGVRVTSSPLTPERVVTLIDARRPPTS